MKAALIQSFLDRRRQPLTPEFAHELDELCEQIPRFCAKALAHPATHVTQKTQLLAALLRVAERQLLIPSLQSLPSAELLHVLDGLRLRRLNGRRVREIGLQAILGHDQLAPMAANHRQRVLRIIKHLLGERTWSSVRRFLEVGSPAGDRFLERVTLRFAADAHVARETLCFLAGLGFDSPQPKRTPWIVVPWLQSPTPTAVVYEDRALDQSVQSRHTLAAGEGMPRATLSGIRGTYHRDVPANEVRQLSAPVSRRGRLDGVLTQALKHALASSELTSYEAILAAQAGDRAPVADLSAAVVLDLSASATSSGERLHHPAALGMALVARLQQSVREVSVYQVGGSDAIDGPTLARPQGASDVATAILQAAQCQAEAIVIISDGYENQRQGDAAQVIDGIRRLRIDTAIYHVVPVFSAAENLSRRRLSDGVPVVPVEHEAAVGELSARLLLSHEQDEISPSILQTVEDLIFGGVQ